MAKVTSYATVTTLNESCLFYCSIDTDADSVFESRKTSIASVRAHLLTSVVADGASAVGFNWDTPAYTTAGALLASISNNGTLKWSVDKDGNMVIKGTLTGAKGADVASATALPLIGDGNYVDVTGTTTITSFDSVGVGTIVELQFDGILTLTHHATDLVLPDGVDIITAAGDHATFVEYASGDWRLIHYTSSVIQIKNKRGADVASAAALDLGLDGNYFHITGTTGITSINTLGVGTIVHLYFDDVVTLTHHATDLQLPSDLNVTTADGDHLTFVEYAAGDWRLLDIFHAEVTGQFGSLYFSVPATTTLSAATPAKAAGTTAQQGPTPVMFTVATTNRITFNCFHTAIVHVTATIALTKITGGVAIGSLHIYKNGSPVTGFSVSDTLANSTDVSNMAVSGLVSLDPTDYLELWVESDNGDNIQIESGTLWAVVVP